MNVHEYQAKDLMRKFGISVLDGAIATSSDQAVKVATELGGDKWVVKAQIHAGGRGKGGGVKLAKSLDEVKEHAKSILGMTLVTHQTGPAGKKVGKILIEKACEIEHEYYLGIVLDRNNSTITFMGSAEGGVEIEKVAALTPEKIIKVQISPSVGFSPFVARKLAYNMGMQGEMIKNANKFFAGLYKLYTECDCTTAEINPLVTTTSGEVLALDAKLNFDDNALFRHKDILEYRDESEESATESEAASFGLSYIALEGSIGCLVNGAGLAMATMDIIKLHGGAPANFLDVGGSATAEAVEQAFKIILKDKSVKAILVNIFGGIMKCDIIANGIVAAAKAIKLNVPLVVRLEGTNVALGKKILDESGLKLITAGDLAEAASSVVKAATSKFESEDKF